MVKKQNMRRGGILVFIFFIFALFSFTKADWNTPSVPNVPSVPGIGNETPGGSVPLPGECSPTDLSSCDSKELCEAAGGEWTGNECVASGGGCSLDNLAGCNSEDLCESVGGYWEKGKCVSFEEAVRLCSIDLSGCDSRELCEAAGGEWTGSACVASGGGIQRIVPLLSSYRLNDIEDLIFPPDYKKIILAMRTIIGCKLSIPTIDQGKLAFNKMYAYCYYTGFLGKVPFGWMDLSNLLSEPEGILSSTLEISFDVDLSNFSGWTCYIYCAYITEDDLIGYSGYVIKIYDKLGLNP